jgi:hypothetical protein
LKLNRFEYSILLKGLTLVCVSCSLAFPDTFQVSYEAAGVQAPSVTTFYEPFNGLSSGNQSGFVTSFNGSSVTGAYSGNFDITPANVYGGAGGSNFATTNSSYSLALSSSVNYFGIWFSALDAGNMLNFYNGSTLLYSFTPTAFLNLVGSCPGSSFCGNPNNGGDTPEQFAYLNFYDQNGLFNNIVVSESIAANGFESDNHAVATLSGPPGGTVINPMPEPASFSIAALGVGVLLLSKAAWRFIPRSRHSAMAQ